MGSKTTSYWTPLSFMVTKSYIDFDCMDKITLRHFSKYMHFSEDGRHTGLKRHFWTNYPFTKFS